MVTSRRPPGCRGLRGTTTGAERVTACRENKPQMCMSNFGYSGPLTEMVLLGCVAMRARKRIEWDGSNMKITNVPQANKFLRREYRLGWEL